MKSRRFSIFFILLGIAVLFAGGAVVRLLCAEVVYPFERMGLWTREAIMVRLQGAWHGLCAAQGEDSLQAEVDRLRVALADAEGIALENAELRTCLDFAQRHKPKVVTAPVFSRGGSLQLWPVLGIGSGALAGVQVGDVVMVPEGVVGSVIEVSPHTAVVRLISDPASRVAVSVEAGTDAKDAILGILVGGGGVYDEVAGASFVPAVNPAQVRFLPKDREIRPRMRIVTEGSGGVFSRGLEVGSVRRVVEKEGELFQTAEIELAVDAFALRYVYVLTKQEGSHEAR